MTRQTLYRLIDDLPEGELTPAARYLEFLAYRESEDAWDDPDYQEYVLAKVRKAEEEIARGQTVSLLDAKKHFPQCFGE
jgi:hypothetical protein